MREPDEINSAFLAHARESTQVEECLVEQPATRLTRRTFLRNVSVSAAALVASACGGGGSSAAFAGSNSPPTSPVQATTPAQSPGSNLPPVWALVPTISFTEGIAASFSIAAFVTDAENDQLTITKNLVALPAGVTYDAATKSFVYDGMAAIGATSGHVLTATEG